MLGGGDSGDALKVREELDFLKAGGGQEIGDGRGLTIADFEGDEAAGDEAGEGLWDETAVDVEAVGAGVDGRGWLVVADFYGECGAIDFGNIGRVGDDDFEFLVGDGSEEIVVEKSNLIGKA